MGEHTTSPSSRAVACTTLTMQQYLADGDRKNEVSTLIAKARRRVLDFKYRRAGNIRTSSVVNPRLRMK